MSDGDLSPAERLQALEREDLEAVLSTPAGRRFVWQLLSRGRTFSSSFSAEALEMAYFEGARSVGLELMVRIQTDAPRRWLEMLTEAAAGRT